MELILLLYLIVQSLPRKMEVFQMPQIDHDTKRLLQNMSEVRINARIKKGISSCKKCLVRKIYKEFGNEFEKE